MQVVASKELSPPVFNGAVSTDVSPPAALKECRNLSVSWKSRVFHHFLFTVADS